MTRLSRPLVRAQVRAADDAFYAAHKDFVHGERRLPLSETNPAQSELRKEWVRYYKEAGGEVEPSAEVPAARPNEVAHPCAPGDRQEAKAKPEAAPPEVEDASETEKATIRAAHERAKTMVDSAIANCLEEAKSKPNALVNSYFGINGTTDDDQRKIEQLTKNYQKIAKGLDKASYEVEHETITPGEPYVLAYVRTLPFIHGIGDVHVVFPAFDTQSADDRAGTLVHEMSHYAIGTDDRAYDWETTKWNKLTQAQKMDNAESYGNFARDCYRAHHPGS